jgi:hypothetical protein
VLKLTQESLSSDTPASVSVTEKHAFTFPGSLSPLFLPPEPTDKQRLLPNLNENTASTANCTAMLARESRTKPFRKTNSHEISELGGFRHQHTIREPAFDNDTLELEDEQIDTSACLNIPARSSRIYSHDMMAQVERTPRQIPRNMWQLPHAVSFSTFVSQNLSLPGSISDDPIVYIAVPLGGIDSSFTGDISATHETNQQAEPATLLQIEHSVAEPQRPFTQSNRYAEANAPKTLEQRLREDRKACLEDEIDQTTGRWKLDFSLCKIS